jgi:hypothetical protein
MALAGACCAVRAQTIATLPESSQRAVVGQRIGLTDITVTYHRPLAGGRKIWGGIVPYGQVWRAGANENTTIEFSTPVTVEGQPLAKGIYGLHMMPGTDSWTVIFSKNSSSWGSFTYNQAEDALPGCQPAALRLHLIADSLNSFFGPGGQLINKVSESGNLFLNSQIAVRFAARRGYAEAARSEIQRHDCSDLGEFFERIGHEVLQPQRQRGGLKMQFRLLDIFRERQKSRAWCGREKLGAAVRQGLEFTEILFQCGTQVVCVRINLRDTGNGPIVVKVCPPPDPVCQQRIEGMTIDKNRIGKSRSDRSQNTAHYRG